MNKQQQQQQQGDVPGYCCFHPREVVVGVCAHCLKDRLLLLLAAGDAVHRRSRSRSSSIFALGSSFLQRLDSRHHRGRERERDPDNNNCYSDDDDDTASVASLDDSFISIKFEDNGKATWDSVQSQHKASAEAGKPKPAAPAMSSSSSSTAVVAVEHVKRGGGVTRWRKQVVGRLLQLARWRRSSAAADKAAAERSNSKARSRSGRGAWIRSLTLTTRRRAHGDRAW